ncbi:MAG: SnoaL-like domain protein [Acidobacteriaceae bacterium]|nr:SnoaL-like domain protein [Acidobacteriaceae bacterium]
MKTLLALSLVVAGLLGCAQKQPSQSRSQPAVNLAEAEAAIRATDAQWMATRDIEKAVSFWTDDATLLMPGSPPVAGKTALKAYVAGAMASPGFSITWTTDKIVLSPSGDMAYSTGTNRVTFKDPRGKLITTNNNAVVIWKKQPDGSWKSVIDISTPQPIPASAIAEKK